MTLDVVAAIHQRTSVPVDIHVFDNGSTRPTQDMLVEMLHAGALKSLVLMKENTGCLFNKFVFQTMTESQDGFYVVSDNDVMPPFLVGTCWLEQMTNIMYEHKELAMLALQLPPQVFQQPYEINGPVVYSKFVGNTFKMCRRSVLERAFSGMEQAMGIYGDDSMLCLRVSKLGYKVGFTKDLYCLHMGQCLNWGYEPEQIKDDPRKVGYGKPFEYSYDPLTYEPEDKWKVKVVL